MKLFAFLAGAVAVLGSVCLLALLLAIPVWLLWNWVAVTVLGLKVITLFQALGLTLLCSILFKSSKS